MVVVASTAVASFSLLPGSKDKETPITKYNFILWRHTIEKGKVSAAAPSMESRQTVNNPMPLPILVIILMHVHTHKTINDTNDI